VIRGGNRRIKERRKIGDLPSRIEGIIYKSPFSKRREREI